LGFCFPFFHALGKESNVFAAAQKLRFPVHELGQAETSCFGVTPRSYQESPSNGERCPVDRSQLALR